MLDLGRQFGRYRVGRKVGAGAMGEVYHAHDTQLNRNVALKVLPSSSVPSDFDRERLLSEARSSSALNHPNICVVYDAGDVDGQVYIAMEYVEGQRLADVIPRDGLPADITVSYSLQLADALAHAHGHGILHRDLKSSNIMVTPEARIKLLDFGLALPVPVDKSKDSQATLSLVEQRGWAGTLAYTAPEVLVGSRADIRSDIWSFGVVLYEMAAGRRPFHGRTEYELTAAVLNDSPPPLPDRAGVSQRLIVKRCLEKNPVLRYQHVSEIRAALEAIQSVPGSGDRIPIQSSQGGSLRLRRVAPVGAAVLAALVLLWLNGAGRSLKAHKALAIQSLAVLPFANLSKNPDQEYFADGITDQLIAQLGTISSLRVISRTSVTRYKVTHENVSAIGKELNVDAVVQGSVLRSGDRVRITAQLTDARTDQNLWAQSYDRDLSDVVKLQDEVATAIARQIRSNFTPQARGQLPSVGVTSPVAYQLYLRARYFWNQRSAEGFQKALALFQKAIEEDPNYPEAYCGLADTYTLLPDYGLLPPGESYPLAKGAAVRAIQLNDGLAEAHTSLAGILQAYDRNWAAAEIEYKRAIELNPSYATARQWYGTLLTVLGRHDESVAEERQASELAPLTARVTIDLGYALFHARNYDEATEQAQKALELDPRIASGYELLGRAYLSQNLGNQAIRQYQTAALLTRGAVTDRALLAYAYAKTGRTAQASKILDELESLPDSTAPYYHIAMIHVALKNYDNALAAVEQAYRWERDKWPQYLGVEEAFDPIRHEPRFQAVLHRLQLPQGGTT